MKTRPPVGTPEEQQVVNDLFTRAQKINEAYQIELDRRVQRSESSSGWVPTALYNPLSDFQEEVKKVTSTFDQVRTLYLLLMKKPEFRLPSKYVYSQLDQFFKYLTLSDDHVKVKAFLEKHIIISQDMVIPGTQHYDYVRMLERFALLKLEEMFEFFTLVARAQSRMRWDFGVGSMDQFSGVVFLSLSNSEKINAVAKRHIEQ